MSGRDEQEKAFEPFYRRRFLVSQNLDGGQEAISSGSASASVDGLVQTLMMPSFKLENTWGW
jgi:hypothetical protein